MEISEANWEILDQCVCYFRSIGISQLVCDKPLQIPNSILMHKLFGMLNSADLNCPNQNIYTYDRYASSYQKKYYDYGVASRPSIMSEMQKKWEIKLKAEILVVSGLEDVIKRNGGTKIDLHYFVEGIHCHACKEFITQIPNDIITIIQSYLVLNHCGFTQSLTFQRLDGNLNSQKRRYFSKS